MKDNKILFWIISIFWLIINVIGFTISIFSEEGLFSTSFWIVLAVSTTLAALIYIVIVMRWKKKEKELREAILKSGINQIDNLNPYVFEEWVSQFMGLMGYKACATKKSGDYGLDVIAENGSKKIGIQVKKFNKPVGLKAIQEVIGGVSYYDCSEGWVITSASSFTTAAINLANKNNIKLLAKNDLALLLHKLQQKNNVNIALYETSIPNQQTNVSKKLEKKPVINNPSLVKQIEKSPILKYNNKEYMPINELCDNFTYKTIEYLLTKLKNDNYLHYETNNIPIISDFITNGKFVCKSLFSLFDKENDNLPIHDIEYVKLNGAFYTGMGSVYLWNTRTSFTVNEALDILLKKNGLQFLDESVLNKFKIDVNSDEWKSFDENLYKYQVDLLNEFDIDYIFHDNDLNKYYSCMHAMYIIGMVYAIDKLAL